MSTDRDTTRIVRSWLEDGVTALPDRVLDAVLDQVPATTQRRAGWLARRNLSVNVSMSIRIAAAAAVVAAAAILGFTLLPKDVGENGPTPTASATPVRYTYTFDQPFSVRVALALPPGWSTWTMEETAAGVLVDNGHSFGSGWGLFLFTFPSDNLFADPCDVAQGKLQPVPGPTVDELGQALLSLPRMEVSEPVDIEIDGYEGVQIDVTAPADAAACPDGAATVYDVPGWEDIPYRMALGETLPFRILDVDGERLIIVATDYAQTSNWEVGAGMPFDPDAHAADQIELREMLESMDINP